MQIPDNENWLAHGQYVASLRPLVLKPIRSVRADLRNLTDDASLKEMTKSPLDFPQIDVELQSELLSKLGNLAGLKFSTQTEASRNEEVLNEVHALLSINFEKPGKNSRGVHGLRVLLRPTQGGTPWQRYYPIDKGDMRSALKAVEHDLVDDVTEAICSLTPKGAGILASPSGAVFRVDDNQRLRLLSLQPNRISAMAISAETSRIAVSLDVSDKIAILEMNGSSLYSLSSKALSKVESLAFNPTGSLLAVGHDDGVLEIFDLSSQNNAKLLAAHGAGIRRIQFSPTSKLFASADINGNVKVWELPNIGLVSNLSQLSLPSFQAVGQISTLDFSPDESLILTVHGNFIDLWDCQTGKRVDHFESTIQPVVLAAFSTEFGIIVASDTGGLQTFSLASPATFSPNILERLATQ